MRMVSVGLSYRTAPIAVREAAAIPDEDARTLLRYLVGHAGLLGAAVLSTCNRTDLYVAAPDGVEHEVAPRLARYLDPSGSRGLGERLSTAVDGDAVRHMFRVAGGLESMVVGEVQVLGQLKSAHRMAHAAGTLEARLDYVLRRAIATAKLVHGRTALGRGSVSLSEVAVARARDVAGELAGRGVLLVGSGTMSRLAARRLREHGARVFTTSRGDARERLAAAVGGEAVSMDRLQEVASTVDVVITATDSPHLVLDAPTLAVVQRRRGHRPLCVVDLAVPRDVDPEAARLPGITLIDIDELGRRVDEGLEARSSAVVDAERIIEDELESTLAVIGQRDATAPAITALVEWAEKVRGREVERTFGRGDGSGATREQVDALTRSLVRKLLHGPVTRLREAGDDPDAALILREAFRLDH